MLMFNSFSDTNVLLFTYLFVYNTSVLAFLWTLLLTITTKLKTLYSLSRLSFNSFHTFTLIVLVFSMAGVPPFVGFFSKLFLVVILATNSFALLYPTFCGVLLVGLYFYVQNIRFLLSTNMKSLASTSLVNERSCIIAFTFLTNVLIITIFGLFLVDDILMFFRWLLS